MERWWDIATPLISLISAIGVGWLALLTAQSNANAQAANHAWEMAAQDQKEAAEEVKGTVARTAAQATAATEEVRRTLAESNDQTIGKLDAMSVVVQATHTLVNSNYGASLMATLNALKAVEALTTDPERRSIARGAVAEAEKLYEEHVSKQAMVDLHQ